MPELTSRRIRYRSAKTFWSCTAISDAYDLYRLTRVELHSLTERSHGSRFFFGSSDARLNEFILPRRGCGLVTLVTVLPVARGESGRRPEEGRLRAKGLFCHAYVRLSPPL